MFIVELFGCSLRIGLVHFSAMLTLKMYNGIDL